MEQRLSIITLGVEDLEQSRNFYADDLGWCPSSKSNEHIIFFQMQGFALALYQRNELAQDASTAMSSMNHCFTLAYNVSSPEDVDTILQHIIDIGGEVTKPAEQVFWGGYSGYFKDPDGFLWEVAHNPFATISDDGRFQI